MRLTKKRKTWNAYAAGVGGMGIGTISKILVVAGHLQGYDVTFCDRKGLAIRNGAVYTHVTYSQPGVPVAPIIPYGKADLVLGLDILEAVRGINANSLFRVASPARTAAVVNTAKTETMSTLIGKETFDIEPLEAALQANTDADAYFGADLFALSEKLFGNKVYANMMLLGTAFQRGLIPLELDPIHLALKQTVRPADLETNLQAFNVGRHLAIDASISQVGAVCNREKVDIDNVDDGLRRETSSTLSPYPNAVRMTEKNGEILRKKRRGKQLAHAYESLVESTVATLDMDDSTHRTLALYVYDLVQFEDIAYAVRFVEKVLHVHTHELAYFRVGRGPSRLYQRDAGFPASPTPRHPNVDTEEYRATKAAMHSLHKVMLIKDEVYVAHLLTSEEKLQRDKQRYKVDEANGDRIHYVHLNRPRFTVMGFDFEVDIDTRNWQLNLVKRMKFLRRWLSQWHAKEKAFRDWYLARVIDTFAPTDEESYEKHVRAIEAVETVRGYREIRYPKMEEAKAQIDSLLIALRSDR